MVNSKAPHALKGNQYLVVVSAGKKKVIADAVPGEKFNSGGVAMRVKVGPGLNITGQVASQQSVVLAGSPNVRVINGQRYVWVTNVTGSHLGLCWSGGIASE